MRRLLASVVLLLAVVAGPTAAHAATPLDPLPLTLGTYTGSSDCDSGAGCGAVLDLVGRFEANGHSIQTTATLSWHQGEADAYGTGTISGPRFAGPCRVKGQFAGVDPYLGVQWSTGVECQLTIDGGAAASTLLFSYANDRFFPSGYELVT